MSLAIRREGPPSCAGADAQPRWAEALQRSRGETGGSSHDVTAEQVIAIIDGVIDDFYAEGRT